MAGPQIGVLKNIFVIDTTTLIESGIPTTEKVYINPEIVSYSNINIFFNEGCLSIPGIFEDIKRPDKVEVRYRDLNFDLKEEVLEGVEARVFQHEYDHLQGVLFIDRMSIIRKKLLRSKLKEISKKKYVII